MEETLQKGKTKRINPFLLVTLSFIAVILLGSILLCFPFANTNGKWSFDIYFDHLFTSVSSTCVTGLNVFADGLPSQYTFFGQLVVLIMIQIGGLGFITIVAFIITLFARKLKFKNRYFIANAIGFNSYPTVIKFLRKVILITFTAEIIGVGMLFPVFYFMYDGNILQTLWTSIFHSISSFCNAGFDIIGSTSLILKDTIFETIPYGLYIYFLFVTMLLIVAGGLSFFSILDIFSFKRPKYWKPFTKIVLLTTGVLIFGGFGLFALCECTKASNGMTWIDALFQSVTCRTAGFATYNQENLSLAGKIVSCLLMFIGGSPISTAGGIKTTTTFLIALSIFSYLKGRDVAAFNRRYSQTQILKSMCIVFIFIFIIVICYFFMTTFENNKDIKPDDIVFEIFSAFGTVGLSANLTPYLSVGSKIILCLLMFIGRIGPITLFQIFGKNIGVSNSENYKLVEEEILIG